LTLPPKTFKALFQGLLLLAPLFLIGRVQAKNQVLGQINFVAVNNAAKSSGVWIDGQYIGYLKELKGSKKILLLPGKHQIAVRQSGYQDFTRQVALEPGEIEAVNVSMQKQAGVNYSNDTAELKISGNPERAAVFVDNQFVGHIDQFNGPGQGMLLTPGKHQIKISLPGYETFEMEVKVLPHQKLKLKTNLMRGSAETQG